MNKHERDTLLHDVSESINNIAEINKCKDLFLCQMMELGVITEEQLLVMSAYFIHSVNAVNCGHRLWKMFAGNRIDIEDQDTYYAVSRLAQVPENVQDIISILREQTASCKNTNTKQKKKRKKRNKKKIINLNEWKRGNLPQKGESNDTIA